jgi:RimJ/RimL family protein N-acetyltransferase
VAGSLTLRQTWVNLIARERAGGAAVGYVQATIKPEVTDIAWVIGAAWQRRGDAREAAGGLVGYLAESAGVRRLRALIRDGHVGSERVAVGLGMRVTGEVVEGERVWLATPG